MAFWTGDEVVHVNAQDETAGGPGGSGDALAAVQQISAIPSILEVVCQITGMGFAAVAHVTEEKWQACVVLDHVNFGLAPGGELPIKSTLCDEVRFSRAEIVIDDFASDPEYATHHTPRIYGLQSYISVPIILADGTFFGTLCAIDAKPARLKTGPVRPMFRLFADLIARYIDDQLLVARSRAELAESRQLSEFRERFIAILGHDLRNPLAALRSGVNLLSASPRTDKEQFVLDTMQNSTTRMSVLIDNMLDMARGRLTGGIRIELSDEKKLAATLDQIVAEIRAAHPARIISVRYNLRRPIPLDHSRIGQLLSNLLGNAIAYGSASTPIEVDAGDDDDTFRLSVANGGEPIPQEAISRLFLPFYAGRDGRNAKGLGLGLYIARQIALAHKGRLEVTSDAHETKFTFVMPVEA